MPVLFGDMCEDGLVRVWRTAYQDSEGVWATTEKYPEGYDFDVMPDAPYEFGMSPILYFNPKNKEFVWKMVPRKLEVEESLLKLSDNFSNLVSVVAIGIQAMLAVSGSKDEMLASRIGAIEDKLNILTDSILTEKRQVIYLDKPEQRLLDR